MGKHIITFVSKLEWKKKILNDISKKFRNIYTFHSLIVLLFVERIKSDPLGGAHHVTLLIFSSISKLFK